MPHTTRDESSIAIVGLSCRFPGDASSPSKFWDLLKNARNGFSQSTDRYNAEAFYHPKSGSLQNVIPTKGGYFLKQDPHVFDAAFFNITATEAIALDPRQRIALEVAYEALENAGLSLQKVAGSQTACFMGSSMSDYRDAVARDFGHFPKYHILGVSDEMIANRISHFLDIHGPSATVQTACSSSLVATHIACQSLRSGESEMAIAGGSSGLDYGSTQYFEAHGTGTKVGDPIEIKAIYSTIDQSSSRKRLYVGSVKPNIGHLEAAAGVASIIKGVLALERGLIPPNINFSTPNPAIPLDEWNMIVPTKLTPWPAAKTKRMSISGFVMGGTNAHIVMDAFSAPATLSNGVVAFQSKKKRLFAFSSHDKAGFERMGKSLAEHLDTLGAVASSPIDRVRESWNY
ncbi:Reducing polyketide synthase hmp8 [Cladobotryum mycophilum]|uniref:Reducing polyketide synthase hmp8 n=1 Tax=Cladobotryum mycophilum TaxID=491253 RepID=A0ABR0S8Q5_9HYPO